MVDFGASRPGDMSPHGFTAPPRLVDRIRGWANRLVANPKFQSWASGTPGVRAIAKADGDQLFDLVQGFVRSQALMALVELDLLRAMRDAPRRPEELAPGADLSVDRVTLLLQAGAAMGLLRRCPDGAFMLARQGAAVLGVPGLTAMIRHHRAFYDDLADPVALLRDPSDTNLAGFWPYVFGQGADSETARRYSDLMADSQGLVAEDVLRQVSFAGIRRLMDVGGGSGAFVSAVATAYPKLSFDLFDLPAVVPEAKRRLGEAELLKRVTLHPGSFREDPLPNSGADAISLIRVLYDHSDTTVQGLLAKVYDALPPGGRLIVAEPMGGGDTPDAAGDVYFAFYTLAMGTGRARSAKRIAALCEAAGFVKLQTPSARRPFVTSVVTGTKPI